MAYQKSKTRVLAGSLNLWPPPDKTTDPDSPVLQNWRTDQAGVLRSRKGVTVDGSGLGAAVHSLYRIGNDRYGGVGTTLRTGPDLSTTLTTGFDGNPLSLVNWQGHTWVMNRGKQGKVMPGFVFANWIPAAPASAPTVLPGGEVVVPIVEFDIGEPWNIFQFNADNSYETNPAVFDYDSSNKMSGTESLHVGANPAAKWQVRQDNMAVPIDTRIAGESRNDDQIRLWFYCSNPAAIESIYIVLGSYSATVKGRVQASIDPSILSNDPFSWTELRISRNLDPQSILTSNSQYRDLLEQITTARANGDSVLEQSLVQQRESLAADLIKQRPYFVDSLEDGVAFDWSQVVDIVVEWTCTDACDVHLDGLRAVGGPAASLEGEYAYYVTFVNDYGHESNPGPLSDYALVNKRAISLTGIPGSVDPQVTIKNIYRVGGPLGAPSLVTTLANSVLAWTDDVSNDSAQDDDIRLEVDSDPAPAARGMLGPYLGHLIAWSTALKPARLFWTPVAQPWKWPGSDDDSEGNWIDVGQDQDPIQACTDHGNVLWIYKGKSIWRLPGSPDDNDPSQTLANNGAVGPQAIIAAGSKDYYVSSKGIFTFNGDYGKKISWKIEPIFNGDWADIGGSYAPPMDDDNKANCVLGYRDGVLYFSYPEVNQTSPTMTLVYQEELDRWSSYKLNASLGGSGFTGLHNEGTADGFIGGTAGGSLLLLDQGLLDGEYSIPLVWQSGMLDQGLPDNLKVHSDVVIDFQSGVGSETPVTLTVKVIEDDGTVTTLGTINSLTRVSTPFRLNGGEGIASKRFAVRIEGNATATVMIYGVYVHWYAEQRTGQSFDSGVIALGDDVAQVDRVELELTNASTTAIALHSDLPSGLIASRQTATLAAAATRGVLRSVLAGIVEGRRFRFLATTAGAFQIHRARLRVRSLGEWFDGAAGEFYSSGRLNFNSRVNEMKEVELDYDLPSGGTLDVYSEQPGGGQLLRFSVAIPATTERERTTFIVNGSGDIEGSSFEIRVTSTGIGRLWGGVARVRPIGTWIGPGETWKSLPWAPNGPLNTFHGELEIDYSSPAASTLNLLTDLPDRYLTSKYTATVALSTTRRVRVLRLNGQTQGYLAEVTLQAVSAGIRLYGMRLRLRALGQAAAWVWQAVPNIQPTGNEWVDVALPMSGGSKLPNGADDQWRWVNLDVDAIQ